jgi:Protein of unknown function (DUF2961)
MPVLALALGWLLLASADPQPAPPGKPPPAGRAAELADLADLARIGVPAGQRDAGAKSVRDAEPAEYLFEAAARSRQVYLLPGGPRTLRELVIEPTAATAEAWRSARLRLTWETDDPDAGAGVDLPLGLLFGRFAPGAGLGTTLLTGPDGAAWVCRFPMPYRTQGLLEVDTEKPLEGRIRLRSTAGVALRAGYFRAASWPGPARLADTGRGHIAGLLVVENKASARPDAAAGTGQLVLDGRARGPLARELGLPGSDVATPTLGRLRAGSDGPTAAYRWLVADPLQYDRTLVIEPAPGRDAVNGVGAGSGGNAGVVAVRVAVFWYAERPRAATSGTTAPGSDPHPPGR